MCNSKFGFTGQECNQMCSFGVAILAINISLTVLFFGLFAVSGYLAVGLLGRHRLHRLINPVFLTLFCTSLGSILFVAFHIVNILAVNCFPSTFQSTDDGDGNKTEHLNQGLDYAGTVTDALGYCISICSVVLLPLTWVSLILAQ